MLYRQSRANLGYVAILSNAENFDVCTVTMGVAVFRPPYKFYSYHIMPGIIGSVITAKEDEIEVNLSSYFVRTKYSVSFHPSGQNMMHAKEDEISQVNLLSYFVRTKYCNHISSFRTKYDRTKYDMTVNDHWTGLVDWTATK